MDQLINLKEESIVLEVKKDEDTSTKENIPISSQQSELNQEEPIIQVEEVFEDFELVLREEEEEEEKQPQHSEAQPEVVKAVSQYEEQLVLLASMGFLDRNLNESMLIQFKNLSRVIDQLLKN